jgi:hypothetical protein
MSSSGQFDEAGHPRPSRDAGQADPWYVAAAEYAERLRAATRRHQERVAAEAGRYATELAHLKRAFAERTGDAPKAGDGTSVEDRVGVELEWVEMTGTADDRLAWQASGGAHVYVVVRVHDGRLVLSRWRAKPNQSAGDVARQAAANAIEAGSYGFAWRVAQQYEDGRSEPFFPAWQYDKPGGLRVTSTSTARRHI